MISIPVKSHVAAMTVKYSTTTYFNNPIKENSLKHIKKSVEKSSSVQQEDEEKLGVVNSDEELQPQWRALENRVNQRRSKKLSEGAPRGRSPRRPGAWDHEVV